jgi:hypothetical protein
MPAPRSDRRSRRQSRNGPTFSFVDSTRTCATDRCCGDATENHDPGAWEGCPRRRVLILAANGRRFAFRSIREYALNGGLRALRNLRKLDGASCDSAINIPKQPDRSSYRSLKDSNLQPSVP